MSYRSNTRFETEAFLEDGIFPSDGDEFDFGFELPGQDGPNWNVYTAASRGNTELLLQILQQSSDLIDVPDSDGFTAMHHAAMNGHAAAIRCLVQSGSAALDAHNAGTTPMHLAAKSGHAIVIEVLAQLGSKAANFFDFQSRTPLYLAVESGNTAVVELLVRIGSQSIIDQPDEEGMSPLHLAAMLGNADMIELLIRLGSKSINRLDDQQKPPIFHAHYCQRTKRASAVCTITLLTLGARCLGWKYAHFGADEDEATAIRQRVYFAHSLTFRLLFELDRFAYAERVGPLSPAELLQATRPKKPDGEEEEFQSGEFDGSKPLDSWGAIEFNFVASGNLGVATDSDSLWDPNVTVDFNSAPPLHQESIDAAWNGDAHWNETEEFSWN